MRVKCEWCGEVFNRRPSHVHGHVFCSEECYGKWYSEHSKGENNPCWRGGKITKVCEVCGKSFEVYPCRSEARFCSNKCRGIAVREVFKGRPLSEETKKKLGEKMRNRWQDFSFRKKMSKVLTGRKFSDEAKRKMASLWEDEEYVQHVLEGMHKKWDDPKYRNKMLKLLEERNKDPEFTRARINGLREFWKNLSSEERKKRTEQLFTEEARRNHIKSLIERPTAPEETLIHLIEEYGFPFKYVGDGRVIIGKLNPDFIHNDGEKKIIEVFGRVFHDPKSSFRKKIPWYQQYWGRMAYFAQFGYDCLIIWDDELSDEATVAERINSFTNKF